MLSFKEWKELNSASIDLGVVSNKTTSAIEEILEAKKKMKKKMDPEAIAPEEDEEEDLEDEEVPEDEKEVDVDAEDEEDGDEEEKEDAETGDGEVVEPSSEKDTAMFMKKKMKKKMCDKKKSKKESTEASDSDKQWWESLSNNIQIPKKKVEDNSFMPKLCPMTGVVLKD